MNIEGSVALVTGANRGLGAVFAAELLERGATRVYAAARNPESITVPGVEPVRLDVTDEAQVRAAADLAGDVTLLINNAGVSAAQNLVRGEIDETRRVFETNFFGTLSVTRAFADVLGRNGGGGIVNVLSALSFFAYDGAGSYAASKAAEWMLTNGTRVELAPQGTQVLGLVLGAADTDMMAGYDGPLLTPAEVVSAALDGLVGGKAEVLVDEWSRIAKAGLAEDPADFYAKVTTP